MTTGARGVESNNTFTMRKSQTCIREADHMTELMPDKTQLTIRPMTEEEAERTGKVLEEVRELGKRILARRKGKPLPPSWKLIRQAREDLSKRI